MHYEISILVQRKAVEAFEALRRFLFYLNPKNVKIAYNLYFDFTLYILTKLYRT